jgi:hypothetical protein
MNFEFYKESKLTIKKLKLFTKKTMFKQPINVRKKEVGKVTYLGWSKEIYSYDINKLVSATNFYFLVEGKKYFDKKRKKYLRPKYLQILQVPYIKDYPKRFKFLYDEHNVKIYSSDPSFKYYLAFALNKANAVVVNKYTKKELGIALTHYPKIRNPKLHKEMNKHFYKLVEFISTKKVEKYMSKKYYLGINKMPQIKG